MISISPKADVEEPCCDFDKSTGQGRVVWRKITESNCHRCQWTGFQVQLASKASIFQNCGAGRENRTLTLSLARTQATITSYPQKLGGNGEIRTLGTHYCVRQVSNLLPSSTRPRFQCCYYIFKLDTSQSKSGTASSLRAVRFNTRSPPVTYLDDD